MCDLKRYISLWRSRFSNPLYTRKGVKREYVFFAIFHALLFLFFLVIPALVDRMSEMAAVYSFLVSTPLFFVAIWLFYLMTRNFMRSDRFEEIYLSRLSRDEIAYGFLAPARRRYLLIQLPLCIIPFISLYIEADPARLVQYLWLFLAFFSYISMTLILLNNLSTAWIDYPQRVLPSILRFLGLSFIDFFFTLIVAFSAVLYSLEYVDRSNFNSGILDPRGPFTVTIRVIFENIWNNLQSYPVISILLGVLVLIGVAFLILRLSKRSKSFKIIALVVVLVLLSLPVTFVLQSIGRGSPSSEAGVILCLFVALTLALSISYIRYWKYLGLRLESKLLPDIAEFEPYLGSESSKSSGTFIGNVPSLKKRLLATTPRAILHLCIIIFLSLFLLYMIDSTPLISRQNTNIWYLLLDYLYSPYTVIYILSTLPLLIQHQEQRLGLGSTWDFNPDNIRKVFLIRSSVYYTIILLIVIFTGVGMIDNYYRLWDTLLLLILYILPSILFIRAIHWLTLLRTCQRSFLGTWLIIWTLIYIYLGYYADESYRGRIEFFSSLDDPGIAVFIKAIIYIIIFLWLVPGVFGHQIFQQFVQNSKAIRNISATE